MMKDASNQSGHSAGGRGGREWDGTRRADPAAAKERRSAIGVSPGTRTHTDPVRGASRYSGGMVGTADTAQHRPLRGRQRPLANCPTLRQPLPLPLPLRAASQRGEQIRLKPPSRPRPEFNFTECFSSCQSVPKMSTAKLGCGLPWPLLNGAARRVLGFDQCRGSGPEIPVAAHPSGTRPGKEELESKFQRDGTTKLGHNPSVK